MSIYLMNADGTDQRRLTSTLARDGLTLYFVNDRPGRGGVEDVGHLD